MKKSKRISKIAQEIMELERLRDTMDDIAGIEAKIDKIMSKLTVEEVLEIDEYIAQSSLTF